MKKVIMVLTAMIIFMFGNANRGTAGELDILVNKLVEKGILTPHEAAALKAEAKEEAAKELAETKVLTTTTLTQKIKINGDIRYRTQIDWNKTLGPAHQEIRQRVRARLGIEGKVNDEVKAGVYAVTGGNDPRSTNQTLTANFSTQDLRLDGYYIDWTPQISSDIGTADLWLGKFKNRLRRSELVWDGDIWPAGTLMLYESPAFDFAGTSANLIWNAGLLWVDEIATSQRDPLLFVAQAGMDIELTKEWDSNLGLTISYYDFSHFQGNQDMAAVGSSGTNTTWTGALAGSPRYDFNMIDLLAAYDSKQFLDIEFPYGLYTDFLVNTDPSSENFAFLVGFYLGSKKVSNPGEWKTFAEYRYLERDAVPDILPDSDFPGFTQAGVAASGGTNGQGLNYGVEYAIFKNTVLSAEYYLGMSIDASKSAANFSDDLVQLLQLDIKVKF